MEVFMGRAGLWLGPGELTAEDEEGDLNTQTFARKCRQDGKHRPKRWIALTLAVQGSNAVRMASKDSIF